MSDITTEFDVTGVTVNKSINPKTADTLSISSSFDASPTGALPNDQSQLTTYIMGGEPSSTVNTSYRNILETLLSSSQSTATGSIAQAQAAISIVQMMMQLRESALTGSDYVNNDPSSPFVMDQAMVQSMDTLSIQMAQSGVTPAKIIAWAQQAGLISASNPTSYTDIQNTLATISSALSSIASSSSASSLTAALFSKSTTAPRPDLAFTSWQSTMNTTDGNTLLLHQIQSTFPANSLAVDTGDGTGSALQTNYSVENVDPSVISTYNQLIADLNTVVGKDPSSLTRDDVTHVVNDMVSLRSLANGVNVLDPSTGAYSLQLLSSPMLQAIDTLSRSLDGVGLVTSSISALNAHLPAPTSGTDAAVQDLSAWIAPATGSSTSSGSTSLSIAQTAIHTAQNAGATAGSIQAMIEIQYINAGTEILQKQLTSLNQALVATQNTAQLLGTLQQIKGYLNVNAPTPLALQAYSHLSSPADKATYVGEVQTAIFNRMSSLDKTQAATLLGIDPSTFTAADITPAIYHGIPALTDGSGVLTGSNSIQTLFNNFTTSAQNAYNTWNSSNQTTGAPSDAKTFITSLNSAETTLINNLATLAYQTLPNANLVQPVGSSPQLLDNPVVPASQINALRQFLVPFLTPGVPIDTPDSPPYDVKVFFISGSPTYTTYTLGQAPVANGLVPMPSNCIFDDSGPGSAARAIDSYGNVSIDPQGHVTSSSGLAGFLNYVSSQTNSLFTNVSQLFNSISANVVTSSGQTQLQNPASYGLLGNLQWNATDIDLGTALNTAAAAFNPNATDTSGTTNLEATINALFSTYQAGIQQFGFFGTPANIPAARAALEQGINNELVTLVNSGALTTDQQGAIQTMMTQIMQPPAYFNQTGPSIGTDTLGALLKQIEYSTILYNPKLSIDVATIINQFKEAWVATSMSLGGTPIPHYNINPNGTQGSLVGDATPFTTAFSPIFTTFITALQNAYSADVPSSVHNDIFSISVGGISNIQSNKTYFEYFYSQPIGDYYNKLAASGSVGVFSDAASVGKQLQNYLLTPYANTPNGMGIEGMFSERMSITPSSDPNYISSDSLVATGLPSTPDFNLQSQVVQAYNQLSSSQKQAFISQYLNNTTANTSAYAAAIGLLTGPTSNYPAIAPPTSATIQNGTYIPIPAQAFATYYQTIKHSVTTPILTEAQMSDPTLSATNFDTLAAQIYNMTIPPFISLPSGQTMQAVLNTLLSTRAQLAQQLSGLQLAQSQQQAAGGNAAVTPIVQYVSKVLADLNTIPDPTSSNYSATTALAAVTNWIMDGYQLNANSTDTAVQAAAANAGTVATDLQTAITAATNMNGTQQQNFQQYMTVFSQFMQSASALLTSIMEIMQAFITGMK